MAKILIVYASMTGNTELLADIIADYLAGQEHEIKIKTFDFDWVEVEELAAYDAVIVGTHTWDDGELPYEVEDFYEELEDVDLAGQQCAVFGSADSFYDSYGGAVDLMADRLADLGGDVLQMRLKVDLDPDKRDVERCHTFAEQVIQRLS